MIGCHFDTKGNKTKHNNLNCVFGFKNKYPFKTTYYSLYIKTNRHSEIVLAILPINEFDREFAPKTCVQSFFKVDQSVRKLSWSPTNKDQTVIKFVIILLIVLKFTYKVYFH